jgi:murein DD-endopeptidase
MHLGTDFAVPIGTPVKAPQDGVVSRTGSDNMNGTFVEIDSGGVIHSLLHLSQSKVTSGQQVKKGQVVGLSGNTGYSTGPHLHWSKRVAGRPVDPMANIG